LKDYRIILKVKNNYLLKHMENKGIRIAAELSRLSGVAQSSVGDFLNLKQTPYGKNGEYLESIKKIAAVLDVPPSHLFPPQHLHEVLNKNIGEIEINKEEALCFSNIIKNPEELILDREQSGQTRKLLSILSPREECVIRERNGFDDRPKTLDEIGRVLGVDKERIRQIESKALRKLRRKLIV